MQLIKTKSLEPKPQPVIYEVNLTVDVDVIDEFDEWLQKHVDEMLAIPGFISASTSVIDNNDDTNRQRSVQYKVVDRASLETYFENDAERMRSYGIEKFADKLSAQRRVLSMSQAVIAEEERCANCGTQLEGRFCVSCGQREEQRVPTMLSLVREFSNATLGLESKLWRSILVLLFRPGRLTAEYLTGKRQRYTSPLRLYLLFSIAAFAYLSYVNSHNDFNVNFDGSDISFTGHSAEDEQESVQEETLDPDSETNTSDSKDKSVMDGFTLNSGFLTKEHEATLEQRVISVGKKIETDFKAGKSQAILIHFLKPLPKALLIFLPFIALAFKLIYIGSGKYYIEHLIYLLHAHAYVFLVLLVTIFLLKISEQSQSLDFWLSLLILVFMAYSVLAPRIKKYHKEFGQKWFRVIVKSLFWVGIFFGLFKLVFNDNMDGLIIILWCFYLPYYLFRSLRVVYARGRLFTSVNIGVIFFCYLFLWVMMLLLTVAFAGYTYG